MLRIGKVTLKSSAETYNVVWLSDDLSNERIDVIRDISDYKQMDTTNCEASYIKGSNIRCYGTQSLVSTVIAIKQNSALYPSAEDKKPFIKDGKFYLTIDKGSDDLSIKYHVEMVNGKLSLEYFETPEGVLEFENINDTEYVPSIRPINWEEYENLGSFSKEQKSDTIVSGQAEFYSEEELLRKYPQITHVLNNDYVVIGSYEEAEERLNQWINSKEQLKSVDIESYGTDWGPGSTNRITGVFLGLGTKWSTYFPFRQENFKYNLPIEYLAKIFNAVNEQPPMPEVIILAFNAKFEVEGFFQEFHKLLRIDVDPFLLAVLANPIIKKGTHTLKKLTTDYEGLPYLELKDIFIGPVKFNVLPEGIVKLYGCPDATSPAKIYPWLLEKIPKDETFVSNLEMQLIHIKAMNEYFGIRLDQERLSKLIADYEYVVNTLTDLFKKMHHTSKNINSSQVMADILYNKLRCKVEERTDKGAPSTSKYAINKIIKTGKIEITSNTPIPKPILDRHGKPIITGEELASNKYPSLIIYQTMKQKQKELGALKRLQKKSVNGRFKFYINQSGAGSNRQTSDAHQFSDDMKSCALSDSPYHGLVSCDWKQVELRILAGMAGQKDLMELEADMNIDIHRAILSIIQKKPIWAISDEERKDGKACNFGVVYGISEYGLAAMDFGIGYTKEHLQIERKKIADFYNGLPNIKAFVKSNEEFLKKNGYITTAFKYYRYFPELLDPTIDDKTVSRLVRSGGNTPVQGTGAQMLKMVEVKVFNYIHEKGWDKLKDYDGEMLPMVRMILPIHDEILLSYDKSIPMEEIITMFKECMELDIDGFPPFYAAPAFIDNWYQGKDSAYEVDLGFRDKVVEEYKKGVMLLTGKDYLKVLNEYRDNEIREYMDNLVALYKTDTEIAKHVRDDSITHTLIEVMIPKGERKKFTHEERILEATRRYLAKLNDTGRIEEVLSTKSANVEKDDTQQYMDLDEWTTSYTRIDANGDLITELIDDGYEDKTEGHDDDYDPEQDVTDAPKYLYCLNEVIIDFTNIPEDIAENVNQSLQELYKDDGYYTVVYLKGSKVSVTPFKIDYSPELIENVFAEHLGRLEATT